MGLGAKIFLLGLVGFGCLAAPASASASFTFGADLTQTADQTCNTCSAVTLTKSDGTPETGSPISGVLVSAQIRTGGGPATGSILILHPTGNANEFRNDGEVPITVPLDATVGGTIRPAVPARLKIAAGDRLGVSFPGMETQYLHSDPDGFCASRLADHAAGTTVGYNPNACSQYEILVQGIVEADADGDEYGDETQDQCPTNAALQTACPDPPVITATVPGSPANDNDLEVKGTVGAGSPNQVKIYTNATCSGPPAATGTVAQFTGTGIALTGLPDDATTHLGARATQFAPNTDSGCSAPFDYIEDSTPPETQITASPTDPSNLTLAGFTFSGNPLGGSGVASFECKLDDDPVFEACSSPQLYSPLADGPHTFQVRGIDQAGNVDASPATFTWTIDTTAPATTAAKKKCKRKQGKSASIAKKKRCKKKRKK